MSPDLRRLTWEVCRRHNLGPTYYWVTLALWVRLQLKEPWKWLQPFTVRVCAQLVVTWLGPSPLGQDLGLLRACYPETDLQALFQQLDKALFVRGSRKGSTPQRILVRVFLETLEGRMR